MVAKKEGEPEEMAHLTQEGSFEDAIIVADFSHNLNAKTKRTIIDSWP